MLKNGVRKILEMISGGVNKEHLIKAINIYGKLCNDEEYRNLFNELKNNVTGRTELDIDKLRNTIDKFNESKKYKRVMVQNDF